MGEDIIDMDLNMEGGRKETDEEGKEIAAGTDRSASEQTAPYEAEAAGTEQHIEDDEEIPQLIMEHSGEESGKIRSIQHLDGMYQKWFLDYASYVILERAVPYVNDGLKPVQRRILHSMRELDDGRYNKVANIIGNTMKYHPHGDASIGDALVQLGQKDLLIDCQGNWGNILTGDGAAAPRYIEARLSKFALEVVFNPKTTNWKPSYDGRNREPITLPIKFPLLLAQGVEGIAVGLASKILPHNFNELIDACIAHLKHEDFVLYPDFPTGGHFLSGSMPFGGIISEEDNLTGCSARRSRKTASQYFRLFQSRFIEYRVKKFIQFVRFYTHQSSLFINHALTEQVHCDFHHSRTGTFTVTSLQEP